MRLSTFSTILINRSVIQAARPKRATLIAAAIFRSYPPGRCGKHAARTGTRISPKSVCEARISGTHLLAYRSAAVRPHPGGRRLAARSEACRRIQEAAITE